MAIYKRAPLGDLPLKRMKQYVRLCYVTESAMVFCNVLLQILEADNREEMFEKIIMEDQRVIWIL